MPRIDNRNEKNNFSELNRHLERCFFISMCILIPSTLFVLLTVKMFSPERLFVADFLWSFFSLLLAFSNVQAWCFFAEFLCGNGKKLMNFLYLKTVVLFGFVFMFYFGRWRAVFTFCLLLVLFLVSNATVYLLLVRRENRHPAGSKFLRGERANER